MLSSVDVTLVAASSAVATTLATTLATTSDLIRRGRDVGNNLVRCSGRDHGDVLVRRGRGT